MDLRLETTAPPEGVLVPDPWLETPTRLGELTLLNRSLETTSPLKGLLLLHQTSETPRKGLLLLG